MTPEQKDFYILGLKDAIKELEAEIDSCKIEFSGEARAAIIVCAQEWNLFNSGFN